MMKGMKKINDDLITVSELFSLPELLLILIMVLALSMSSCSKDNCVGVYQKIESNEAEAKRMCVGLANDYPELEVISDELISMDCESFSNLVTSKNTSFCSISITERITIYKKY